MHSLSHMLSYGATLPAVVAFYVLTWRTLVRHSGAFRDCADERRRYIVSNLVKAGVLGLGVVGMSPCLFGLLAGGWPCGGFMRLVAPAYVSLDLISLAWVKNHHATTKAHHIAVVLCGVAVALREATPGTVIYHICVFALFSAAAWPANLYLGGRFLVPRGSRVQRLGAAGAAAVYAVVYVAHMFVHLRGMHHFGGWLYLLPLLFGVFMTDDVKLLRWLLAESQTPAAAPPARPRATTTVPQGLRPGQRETFV